MGQRSGDGIAGHTGGPAGTAPRIRGGDLAQDFGFRSGDPLPGRGEPQPVKAGERGEIGGGEGRMRQRRGLSKLVSVVTSILLEDLDFFAPSTRPGTGVLNLGRYTLNPEEPLMGGRSLLTRRIARGNLRDKICAFHENIKV